MSIPETWKDIPGHEGSYQVSDLGRVRSLDHVVACGTGTRRLRGRVLKTAPLPTGHLTVCLGLRNTQPVHRCVLLAFFGPGPRGAVSLHLNGDETDNRLANLAWGTRSENGRHKKWHKGQINYRLSPDQVAEIKRALIDRKRGAIAALAARFGVSETTVGDIAKGRTHVDVQH